MQSVESVANREAREVAQQMERQAGVLRHAEERLQGLKEYLAGYIDAPDRGTDARTVSAMQIAETHLFVERLRGAVDAQASVVESARSLFESLRARWIAKHLRTMALSNVVHKFRRDEATGAARLEQRTDDELTARYRDHQGTKKPLN